MDKLEKLNKDPEFYQYMSHEEDERKIYNSRMYEAEQKGLQEGMKKGSINKSMEIAKELSKMKMSIENIMKVTGLTKTEIENLK